MFFYFASIGLAFMFIEVFFIHKMILPYGSPTDAFAVTLLALLVSTGAGSLMSSFISDRNIGYCMAFLPVLLVLALLFFEYMATSCISFIAILPIGIFLGFYFPRGLTFLCREERRVIPIAYAVNGAFSIMAPPLASIIAVACGSRILLVLSFVLYGFSLLLLSFACHWHKGHTA